jgi:selenocysteine lyase/cysteine desulfurase
MSEYVYLDNAATTFPKPLEVIQHMCDFYSTRGVNPGRTGFDLALEAEDALLDARQALTDFFGGAVRDRLVFSHNVTDALNLLIGSVLEPGDHAITLSRAQLGAPAHVPTRRRRRRGGFRAV